MNNEPPKLKPIKKKVRKLNPQKPPSNVQREYQQELNLLIKEIQQDVKEQILPIFEERIVLTDAQGSMLVTDSVDDILSIYTQQMQGLRDKYDKMKARFHRMAKRFGTSMDSATKKSFNRMLTRIMGAQTDLVEILGEKGVQAALFAETENNVNLIKTIPEKYFNQIQLMVQNNFIYGSTKEGGLVSELMPKLRKGIRALAPKAKKAAKRIARDQTGKINSALSKIRQTNLGIEEYIWRNKRDLRVRGNPSGLYPDVPKNKNHWDREGKVFRWDSPPPGGHPGEDINCRCHAQPVIKLDGVTTEEVKIKVGEMYNAQEKRLFKQLKSGKLTTAQFNEKMRSI